MSVSYGGDSITFADSSTISSGYTGFKNRIINGAMTISQRYGTANTSQAANAALYSIDRFRTDTYTTGQTIFTQQVTDVPDAQGFTNSFKITMGTANSSPSSANSDFCGLSHLTEGYNTSNFMWGTANAKTVTISFWVKSSVAGKYGFSLDNYKLNSSGEGSGMDRSYVTTYDINSANTWEKKTITIPGCTTGVWAKLNDRGVNLRWCLGAASSLTTATVDTWVSTTGPLLYRTSDCVQLPATTQATWQITGVQMEVGSTASSFEYRPYTTELQLCQRYCQQFTSPGQVYLTTGHVWSSTLCQYSFLPKVQMRTHPALETGGTLSNLSGQTTVNLSGISLDGSGYYVEGQQFKINGNMSSSSYTSGYSCALLLNSNGAYIRFNAEL